VGTGWRQAAITSVVAVWCVCTFFVVGWIAYAARSEPATSCQQEPGDSNYGEASWTWFPLGLECTYTEEANGIDEHEPADWGLTVVVAGLAGSGVVIHGARRGVDRQRPPPGRERQPPPEGASRTRRRFARTIGSPARPT
jgi:hypothetical protein